MEFETKYYGILKNFDFENINKNNFKVMIASGVFEEFELSSNYENEADYFISENDKMSFGYFFLHNRKQYEIKKDIISDIIYVQNWFLIAFANSDVDSITNQIDVLVLSELNLESKLNLLESEYKKYFNKISDKEFYPLFHNNTYSNGYEKWEDYIYDEIIENENFDIAVSFLKGINNFLPTKLYNQWVEYFIFSKISNHIEKTRDLILNINKNQMEDIKKDTKNIDLSFQISVLEQILNMDNWANLSANKKGEIIHLMIGKNAGNIKDVYLAYDKPKSETSPKYIKDREKAIESINRILKLG